ncbi:MAG: hypothetical protein V4581_17315 [Bacteroidota bacterium]
MKKTLLSLSALFAVCIASAQSYISQPDRTTYEVREYKAEKKAEAPSVQNEDPNLKPQVKQSTDAQPAQQKIRQADPTTTATAQTTTKQPVTTEDKKVAQNKKK